MSNNTGNRRVALVTGAAGGIGEAVAKTLARDVPALVAVVDRDREAGAKVAADIEGVFVHADLARPGQCQHAARQVVHLCGGLDILVNNAGFQHVAPIEVFPEEKWRTMLEVMLTAPFLLTQAAWPLMKKQGWGRIVNIASIHGLVASPHKAAYVAAKHGLLGLTRCAALEGGAHGITVNALCPAYVKTPLVDNQIAAQATTRGLSTQDVVEKVMLEPAAIKRLISVDEIACLVAFLCREEASAVTGSAWTIDLGWTAR